jgi:hypothetical protein
MHPNRKILPVRVLKIWFDVVLALGGVAALIFLAWLALSPFVMAKGDLPAEATVRVAIGQRSWVPVFPVELGSGTAPTEHGSAIEAANLVSAQGDMRVVTHDWTLHFAYLAAVLVATGVILYGIWTLRRVLINVLDNRPFDAANGRLLRRCGYIVLALASAYPFFDFFLADYVLSRIEVTNIDLRPAITFEKDAFVIGLLFLVFGLIFDRGHQIQQHERQLEEDQALTI